MKKAIIAVLAAGAIAGGTAILAADRDAATDTATATETVKDMTAEELTASPSVTEPGGPPDLTSEVTLAILEDLKDPEAAGGLLAIARRHGCSMAQVRIVMAAKKKRLQDIAGDAQVMEPK